jgi:hypothetical protein
VDWTAVGTFVLAVATFVLAFFAWRSIRENQHLITATQTSAKATEESAAAAQRSATAAEETIAEIQRDRVLEYRPFVLWIHDTKVDGADVINIGRGPAVNCLCCAAWREGGGSIIFMTTDLFSLGPHAPRGGPPMPLTQRPGWEGWLTDDTVVGKELSEKPTRFAFCEDQLGTYFYFVPHRSTDKWPDDSKQRRRWVDLYLRLSEELAKTQG